MPHLAGRLQWLTARTGGRSVGGSRRSDLYGTFMPAP